MKSIFEVTAGFGKRFALRVYTRDFFDPSNVPTALFLDYGSELARHERQFTTLAVCAEA